MCLCPLSIQLIHYITHWHTVTIKWMVFDTTMNQAINLHKRYVCTIYVHPFVRFGINMSFLISAVCCCCCSMENGQLKLSSTHAENLVSLNTPTFDANLGGRRFWELTFEGKQTNHAANASLLHAIHVVKSIYVLSIPWRQRWHVLHSTDWLLWRVNILSVNKFCTNSHIN